MSKGSGIMADVVSVEKQEAIHSILQQDYGNIPFLVSGPPGTGKTKTIVEAGMLEDDDGGYNFH